jgi:hypothetical protein
VTFLETFLGWSPCQVGFPCAFHWHLKCSEASGWEESSINDSIGSSDINVVLQVFDLHSTIDPSHIIHLIRQLLPATGKHIHSCSVEVTRNNDCSNPAKDSKCKVDIIVQNVTASVHGQLNHDSLSASDVEDEERVRRMKEEGVNSDSAVLGNSLQSAARSPEVSLTNAIAVGNGKDEDYEDKVEKSKHGDTEEKTEYEDSREEAGCVLWDLAANQIHADFLVSASRTNPEILS